MKENDCVFLGNDPKILSILDQAKNIAVTKAPVLITGEIGCGKKSLSYFIHKQSNRRDYPFSVVDCSLDSKTVENELLGGQDEETGRFIKGAFESANNGSVVLSNIDCMDEALQKKIFKIFQELSDYDIDIRPMATTSKNLSKLVGTGRFHRILYTFIASAQLQIPPLRERKEDIPLIMDFLSKKICESLQVSPIEIAKEAQEKIYTSYWAENVSELKNVLEMSLKKCKGGILNLDDLDFGEKKQHANSFDGEENGIRLMSLKEAERLLIRKALIHTSENRTQAAKILGVSIRTLRNKINEYRNEGANYFINLR